MADPNRARISALVVEDDPATAELERRALLRAGIDIQWVSKVSQALSALEAGGVAVVLLDYQLPDGDCWQVLDAANQMSPRVPVILVTAMGNEQIAVEAIQRGISDYVKKTDNFWEQLPRVIERVRRLSLAEEQLRREQARLAEAQSIAQIGSWEWDIAADSVSWSDELYRIFGSDRDAFGASYAAFLDCIHPEDRTSVDATISAAYAERRSFRNVYRILRRGEIRFIEGRGSMVLGPSGSVVRMLGTAQDVTEREQQQMKLRESDAFFELSLDMLSTASTDGYFRRVNPAFKLLGYSEEELLTTPFIDFVHPEDVQRTLVEVEKLKQGVKTLHFENRYRCKDGSYRWISWVSSPHPAGILYGTGRDITAQKQAEAERQALTEQVQKVNLSLQRSLAEREVLLQEVHHRVKNNLQVISSLINLQMHKLEAGETRDALLDCRTRIEAIAVIHESLYQSSDFACVSFAEYARTLTANAFHAGNRSNANVRLELAVDDLPLTVEQAIPCGLVLNELITNALKHGFGDGRAGIVRVEFARTDQRRARLAVFNDGVGLPANFDPERDSSLGMQLVATLASQLNSALDVVRAPGTTFQLEFEVSRIATASA